MTYDTWKTSDPNEPFAEHEEEQMPMPTEPTDPIELAEEIDRICDDGVNVEHAVLMRKAAAALRAPAQAAGGLTYDIIEKAFERWSKTQTVVDELRPVEVFAQGYFAGWNAKEANTPSQAPRKPAGCDPCSYPDCGCQNSPPVSGTSHNSCEVEAAPTIDSVPSCGQENDYRRATPTPPQAVAPITTEQLDKLQFRRSLHERPATQSSPPAFPGSLNSGESKPSVMPATGAGEAIFAECAEIALEHVGIGIERGDPNAYPREGYDEACRDIAAAIQLRASNRKVMDTLAKESRS